MNSTLEKELREHLDRLGSGQQRRVLDFARALAAKEMHGVSGKALVRFGGAIVRDDLVMIEKTIEAGCEQVNPDEW